jgi:hypothetical protein
VCAGALQPQRRGMRVPAARQRPARDRAALRPRRMRCDADSSTIPSDEYRAMIMHGSVSAPLRPLQLVAASATMVQTVTDEESFAAALRWRKLPLWESLPAASRAFVLSRGPQVELHDAVHPEIGAQLDGMGHGVGTHCQRHVMPGRTRNNSFATTGCNAGKRNLKKALELKPLGPTSDEGIISNARDLEEQVEYNESPRSHQAPCLSLDEEDGMQGAGNSLRWSNSSTAQSPCAETLYNSLCSMQHQAAPVTGTSSDRAAAKRKHTSLQDDDDHGVLGGSWYRGMVVSSMRGPAGDLGTCSA